MTEVDYRKVYSFGNIVSVRRKREYSSINSYREFFLAKNFLGHSMELPPGFDKVFTFSLSENVGMFKTTAKGKRMVAKLAEIYHWEKMNEKDRHEYERLKRKFEGSES
jgi:hypothetical protein